MIFVWGICSFLKICETSDLPPWEFFHAFSKSRSSYPIAPSSISERILLSICERLFRSITPLSFLSLLILSSSAQNLSDALPSPAERVLYTLYSACPYKLPARPGTLLLKSFQSFSGNPILSSSCLQRRY